MKLNQLLALVVPDHPDYAPPIIEGHKNILRFMLAQQRKTYNSTILTEFSNKILIRNLKLLIYEYSEKEVVWGICKAISVCDHPFSTKKVREVLECRYQ